MDAFTLRNDDTYAMVSSEFGRAIQLIRVHENATLEAVGEARSGRPGADGRAYDAINDPRTVDAFALPNGDTYAVVASRGQDAVQLIRVHEDGAMSAADSKSPLSGAGYRGLTDAVAVDAFVLRDGGMRALVGGGIQPAAARRARQRITGRGTDSG